MSAVAQINTLREERAGVFEEMKTLVNAMEAENRGPNAEEKQKLADLNAAIEERTERISNLERLEGMGGLAPLRREVQDTDDKTEWREMSDDERREEARLNRKAVNLSEYRERIQRGEVRAPRTLKEFNEIRALGRPQDDPEYRWAFFRMLTVRDLRELDATEMRALSKATAAAGANLVPTAFFRELIQSLRDYGVTREIARVITTDSGETLTLPSVASHGTAAWTAENAAFTASDESFGTASLSSYKAATLLQISEELLADSAFELEGYIRDEFGARIGVLENTAYVVGDGTGKPTGYQPNVTVGRQAVAGNTTTVPAEDLIRVFHALSPIYRRNAVWVMNDQAILAVRLLKDNDGQFIWQPGLQAGQPDALLGKPVYADPDMPVPAASVKSIVFGDFQRGYWIRDVNGIAFQRLNELYAANGQVGFRAYHRTDGKIVNAAALRAFQHSAT